MTWRAFALAALLAATPLQADPVPAKARVEIVSLLAQLAESGCQFKRNGVWHEAAQARAHLQRKFDYLAEKDAVNSAEQFIERAATRSSMTGQAYWVRCGDRAAVPSGTWLTNLLRGMRTQAAPSP
ncbi:MAG: DUF5329 domain-containing protein [Gammaproteobacteria bacterium]